MTSQQAPASARPAPPARQSPQRRQGGWPDERQAAARPVECARCAAVVEVAKFSAQHTSIQWSPDAVRACAEFAARAADGEPSALIDSCGSLRASIDLAVEAGALPVQTP